MQIIKKIHDVTVMAWLLPFFGITLKTENYTRKKKQYIALKDPKKTGICHSIPEKLNKTKHIVMASTPSERKIYKSSSK